MYPSLINRFHYRFLRIIYTIQTEVRSRYVCKCSANILHLVLPHDCECAWEAYLQNQKEKHFCGGTKTVCAIRVLWVPTVFLTSAVNHFHSCDRMFTRIFRLSFHFYTNFWTVIRKRRNKLIVGYWYMIEISITSFLPMTWRNI